MPPATMTGVSATASRPSSTLNRVISKKLPSVKKFGATAEKNSDLGGEHQQQHPFAVRKPASAPRHRAYARAPARRRRPTRRYDRMAKPVGRDRDQDDRRPGSRAPSTRSRRET